MHELGLARSIAAIAEENAHGRRIREVRVAIGPLACVERGALAFCWDLVTEETAVAGVSLGFLEAENDTFVVREIEFMEDS
ncbi:hydrogenase nickel incorporation protein [Roseovarius sp. A-2]|uniref:hydrogenase maturation nickel metallochaperone HypA n=1 Tax=Roseovarius sp. A-2 TaxID=1570360 RepID=UPI0009B530CE|nr:hydrogenase maturation nickel metallochaperone HypA [Roseovarius sp. A-2]GAW34872.1 hydrogenase nickel incorporation protein [Roseovarius sp. A-2]